MAPPAGGSSRRRPGSTHRGPASSRVGRGGGRGGRARRAPARKTPSRSPSRLVALFVVFALAFSFMALRLFTLQILESKAYAKIAANQRERVITFPARRGAIFDRNGTPLAISVDLPPIYTDPATVKDPVATADALAPVLRADPA